MNPNENQYCAVANLPPMPLRLKYRIRNWSREFALTLFRKHVYRHAMRAMHRFNLHYAPPQMLATKNENHHWCQWCGLRGTTVKHDLNEGIRP